MKRSARPSVRLSSRSTTAAVASGFAAERRADKRYRSTAGDGALAGSITLTAEGRGLTRTYWSLTLVRLSVRLPSNALAGDAGWLYIRCA